MLTPWGRGMLSGFGVVVADSITTTGAVTAGSVAATGNIVGAIVRGTTALEMPTNAGGPTLRATDDTNTGISVVSSDLLVAWTNGIDRWGVAAAAGISTRNATQVTETGARVQSGVITPTALAANTDNWAPSGYTAVETIEVSASAPVNLTGIGAIVAGWHIRLTNTGANTITLIHDATSTAANRFFCPGAANFALTQYKTVVLRYSGAQSRWMVQG